MNLNKVKILSSKFTSSEIHAVTRYDVDIRCDWCTKGVRPKTTVCSKCFASLKAQLGYRRYRNFRVNVLSNNPMCICGKKADMLHHILPWATHPDLFWEESNLEPLCYQCHGLKKKTIMFEDI